MRSMIKGIIEVVVAGTLLIIIGLVIANQMGAFDCGCDELAPVESDQVAPKAVPSRQK